ncbi:NBS-LRR type resistance protein [Cucumis melo var. makuwa]|uniref:NBS-LRR type resistance protein n=1 Tax=Cucumis melo var. makuwa TaxID=1194695 RepID=A0A5A7UGM2_CUCMM|nr:NBS-LRR type resistance protein [Cucumis melo var. makuwa]
MHLSVYQSSAPEGCTHQSSAPEGCTHQSSAPEGCTYQSSAPEDAHIRKAHYPIDEANRYPSVHTKPSTTVTPQRHSYYSSAIASIRGPVVGKPLPNTRLCPSIESALNGST